MHSRMQVLDISIQVCFVVLPPDAVEALREAGLTCETAFCVVDREEGGADELARHGVKLRPLYVAADLLATRKTAANPHGYAEIRRDR